MKRLRVHLDSFSGSLGELPKGQRTLVYALAVLADDPRVSTLERGVGWLESLLHELQFNKLVVEDHAEPYPWHRFNLTDAGRQMLASPNTHNVRAKLARRWDARARLAKMYSVPPTGPA